MSRSALARSLMMRQKKQEDTAPAVAAVPAYPYMVPGSVGAIPGIIPPPPPPGMVLMPPGMLVPGMMIPGLPGAGPMMYGMPPAQRTVHKLTGDDDDDFESPEHKTNALPMYGNTTNFNINNLLYSNIMESDYFRALYQLRTYHEVLHEISASVTHVEPWQTGTQRNPSTAFCLLLKLLLMKLTFKQMNGMLEYLDSPLVRAIGFLYLRYTCPPDDLWKWFENYLEDEEEICPSANPDIKMAMGTYCIKLLTDMNYFGTILPRIPVSYERKFKVMLLLLEEKKKRRRSNFRLEEDGMFAEGTKVRAIYSDKDNEPAWYEAVIESRDDEQDNKYWVVFPEYGNRECVDLGDMDLIDERPKEADLDAGGGQHRSRSASGERRRDRGREEDRRDRRDRGGGGGDRDNRDQGSRGEGGRDSREKERNKERVRDRADSRGRDTRGGGGRDRSDRRGRDNSRSRSRSRDSGKGNSKGGGGGGGAFQVENLMEKVLQSSREASAATGKNYGQRPASYKGSLALKTERYTVREKSPDRGYKGSGGGGGGGGGASRGERDPRDRDRDKAWEGYRGRGGGDEGRDRDRGGGGGHSGNSNGSSAVSSMSSGGGLSYEQQQRMKKLKEQYGDASAK